MSCDGDDVDKNGERTRGKVAQKDANVFLFHSKTRVCESITAEALLETLKCNSGSILIKTDEFKVSSTHHNICNHLISIIKGFMERVVQQVNFESALCTAFSGEDFKHSTISRGRNMFTQIGIFVDCVRRNAR